MIKEFTNQIRMRVDAVMKPFKEWDPWKDEQVQVNFNPYPTKTEYDDGFDTFLSNDIIEDGD